MRSHTIVDIQSAVLFATIAMLLTLPLYAQDGYEIRQYGIEEGLAQITVNDLVRDREGFAWVATEGGLNVFDGSTFQQFNSDPSDSTTISGNLLNTLAVDLFGRIWIGTIGNGLCYYDKQGGKFTRVRLEGVTGGETVSDIAVDPDGGIWISTRMSGLYRLVRNEDGGFDQRSFLSGKQLGALMIDVDQTLWIGTHQGEVYTLDLSVSTRTEPELLIGVEDHIHAMHQADGRILIGSDSGFYIYDMDGGAPERIELATDRDTRYVSSFLSENDSLVWVGTGNGLFLYDVRNRSVFIEILHNEQKGTGLSSNTVYSLLRISPDLILVGTFFNLNLIGFSTPVFNHLSDQSEPYALSDEFVTAVCKSPAGLWVGTSEGGLNFFSDGRVIHFDDNTNDLQPVVGGSITDIEYRASSNTIWVATSRGLLSANLNEFDADRPRFQTYQHDPADPTSLTMDHLTAIDFDSKGTLWAGTYGNGIMRIDVDGPGIKVQGRYVSDGSRSSLVNNFIYDVTVDDRDAVWLGTEGGICRLAFYTQSYSSPAFAGTVDIIGNPDPALSELVIQVLPYREQLWVATRTELYLIEQGQVTRTWRMRDYYESLAISSLQLDDNNILWLGTNSGLVSFDPVLENFSLYNSRDGIRNRSFRLGASFKDVDGDLYFGGMDGLTWFDPEDLIDLDKPVPFYFSSIEIRGKSSGNPVRESHLLESQTRGSVRLPWNRFPLHVRVSAVDFRINKNYDFGYRLIPLDQQWNVLSIPEIQFPNLPPGKYTLQVNGFSRGQKWDGSPNELDIIIVPPWWRSRLAYIVYLVVILAITWWLYRFQLSRQLAIAESKRLKEIDLLKNKLYTNITHEFRTPLTVILGAADTLGTRLHELGQAQLEDSTSMIKRNGQRLLKLVNSMLDLAKLESGELKPNYVQGDVVPYIKYLAESFQSVFDKRNTQLTVYNEIESLTMDFDPDKLEVIISNLLSNAIKFTERGKVILHLTEVVEEEMHHLIIKVKDTGMGIPPDDLPFIFDRFYQVKNAHTVSEEGTGIGLALSKELVMALDGDISVESVVGRGTTFTLSLPVRTRARAVAAPVAHADIEDEIFEQENIEVFNLLDSDAPVVLVVDDNADILEYLRSCLEGRYNTFFARNGQEGMDLAFELIPDIVICDVMMPVMNGYELCARLKNDYRTDHIPVILLTAKATTEDRLSGLSEGADAYLTKPFHKAELLTRMDVLITTRQKLNSKFQQEGYGAIVQSAMQDTGARFILQAVAAIERQIGDPDFRASHLARMLHLSESHLYRKLKSLTGKSTAVFIRSVRLANARKLLLTTSASISEVAYDMGFTDPSWFSRAYKQEFGHSPSETRR